MMICPETYYKEHLKDKNADQIMTAIRSLKREINRLKDTMEHPDYLCTMHPSEDVRISCNREYLERAKKALADVGGVYVPTKSELKAEKFEANIPHISKIEFSIGGFHGGFETRTYTVDGETVSTYVEHSLIFKPSNFDDNEIEKWDKKEFFESFADLHIGEWRREYSTSRFGFEVLDGTQWHLYIFFSNGEKPVKIEGDNAYPYNFDRLLELFDIEQ